MENYQASELEIQKVAEAQLRSWLKRNRLHFIRDEYTPDEVAHLAKLDGHDPVLICQILSHFQDAMQGSLFENRARMQIDLFEMTVKGPLDLTEQWHALWRKLTDGADFDEI